MNRPYRSAFFEFCYAPTYEDAIAFLATRLADPEPWDFSDVPESRFSILKNYLEHTFRRVKTEGKIRYRTDNSHACFNTGLVTRNLESIYAFFERNRIVEAEPTRQPFFFRAFCKESDYQLIEHFGDDLPPTADYFQRPEELIFNPNCRIIPQIDHIIEDNATRMPEHMIGLDTDEVRRRMVGAINEAQKRVKTNYKLAIPQYYENRIQLLLPLCLTPGSPNPDLALVTHKIGTDTYTARTCLTLRMAYNNARLICKPESSWLIP